MSEVSDRLVTIDVDIGGTFTDCFVRYDGQILTGKAETTEHDLSVGFFAAIRDAISSLDVDQREILSAADRVRYSTTVALNKLIAREGSKLGLLMTKGLTDVPFIGRGSQWSDGLPIQDRRNVVDAKKPEPLIPKDRTFPVKERIDYRGNVVRALDEADLREKIHKLVDRGARGFVVSLAWSFRNPTHEHRVREIIKDEYPDAYLGSAPVYLSSEVNPQRGEYERTMTTVLNGYLHRPIAEELFLIDDELRKQGYEDPLMMIHNTGGMAEVFRTTAIDMFNGGPVAALIGSQHLGEQHGYDNVITADMGGTSFDLSHVVDGSARKYDMEPEVEQWRVNSAMLETKSIGAGGGSIATVNEDLDYRLEVGPESAGANPGPACYNQGGRKATVTDADVVLGYLNPDNFRGGEKELSVRQAKRAITRNIANPLDIDVAAAAQLIRKIVDAKMGNMIYKETALRGFDPREFVMLAIGGAGPTHAADIARHANIDTVVTFPYASVFSAYGSSVMDTVHTYEQSRELPLIDPHDGEYLWEFTRFNEVVSSLRDRGVRDFIAEGFAPEDVTFQLELDMKYGGLLDVTRVQSPHAEIDSTTDVADICDAFESKYRDAYSPIATSPESGVLIQNFLLKGVVPTEKPELVSYEPAGADPSGAQVGERDVYWTTADGARSTPVYDKAKLQPENVIEGPAIVEGTNTTIAVTPSMEFEINEYLIGTMQQV